MPIEKRQKDGRTRDVISTHFRIPATSSHFYLFYVFLYFGTFHSEHILLPNWKHSVKSYLFGGTVSQPSAGLWDKDHTPVGAKPSAGGLFASRPFLALLPAALCSVISQLPPPAHGGCLARRSARATHPPYRSWGRPPRWAGTASCSCPQAQRRCTC